MEGNELEAQFHAAMLSVYTGARDECQYTATRFFQMVSTMGGLQAAKILLRASGFSDGLTELWRCGRLDLSMEAVVLEPAWQTLFTEEERATARARLAELGYQPPSA